MIFICASLKLGCLDVEVGGWCEMYTHQDDEDLIVGRGTDDPPVVVRRRSNVAELFWVTNADVAMKGSKHCGTAWNIKKLVMTIISSERKDILQNQGNCIQKSDKHFRMSLKSQESYACSIEHIPEQYYVILSAYINKHIFEALGFALLNFVH